MKVRHRGFWCRTCNEWREVRDLEGYEQSMPTGFSLLLGASRAHYNCDLRWWDREMEVDL